MVQSKLGTLPLVSPRSSPQVAIHHRWRNATQLWLDEALRSALAIVDPRTVARQLTEFAPADVRRLIGGAGIRDEEVFPTPVVLKTNPRLLGYYRLLLGAIPERFYGRETGLALFRTVEVDGTLTKRQRQALPRLCKIVGESMGGLIRELRPLTRIDLESLRRLTFARQFQGATNVSIGKQATADVFLAIADLVEDHIEARSERQLVVKNSSGRKVTISLASDPDVRIQEESAGKTRMKLAIEIKGGTDSSNAHNRAGEAEKSHQKARGIDFRECWTIIALKGLDGAKLRKESPTTDSWFDVAQVLGRAGPHWEEFRSRLAGVVGVPEKRS